MFAVFRKRQHENMCRMTNGLNSLKQPKHSFWRGIAKRDAIQFNALLWFCAMQRMFREQYSESNYLSSLKRRIFQA